MGRKLKVIHIIGGGEFGGAEKHIIQLLSLLPEQQVQGKVICFYEAGLSKSLRELGIEVEVLDFGRFDLRLISALRKVFLKEQPDIIHTHGVKANFFSRLAARKLESIPLVTTVHSLLRYDYIHPLSYAAVFAMERVTRKLNDHFIAVSHALKASLLQDGIPERQLTVVHHGIDVAHYAREMQHEQSQQTGQQLQTSLRQELGLSEQACIIGVVTRLVKIKGIEFIIGAMPQITAQHPEAHLVIVGTGPEEESLQHLTAKLRMQDKVSFIGFREDVAHCLASFDIFVSSSLSEGLGLNVLEAMAATLPIVATNVGGILDFMEDRRTGLLVEPKSSERLASAILELIQDAELAQAVAAQARQLVESEYSLQQMAEQTVAVYERLRTAAVRRLL